MKVLHIVGQLEHGGVATWLETLLRHWPGSLNDVHICANYRRGVGPLHESFAKRCGFDNIHHLPLSLDLFKYQRGVRKIINEHAIQVVHDHRSFQSGASLKAAQRAGVPVRIIYHHTPNDDVSTHPVRRVYSWYLKRLALASATHIWGCSEVALQAQYGAQWQSDERRCSAMKGAVQLEPATPQARKRIRQEFKIAESTPVLGFIGRLTPPKNPLGALHSALGVMERCNEVELLIVGDGAQRGALERLAYASPFSARIHFAGFRRDIADILEAIDIMVQPSYFEGLPLGTLEALTSGVPVVGSTAPGLLAVLPPEYQQLCSAPDDIEGHVQTIVRMLDEGVKRWIPHELLSQYDPQVFAQRVWDGYKGALNSLPVNPGL